MSRYSKKHYEDIAKIICESIYTDEDDINTSLLRHKLIKLFELDNPNFDKNRFISASSKYNAN